MAAYASKYFGEPTDGILRTRIQDGHVDIGDIKTLGDVDEPKK